MSRFAFGFLGGGGSGGGGGLTSVGLSMPSAFNVTNSPLTSNGVLNVLGAGTANQYVRGDGSLATFPTNTGGGSAVVYYLNGSVNQGVIGGNTYYQMDKSAVFFPNADFSIASDGYIAQFITNVNDPQLPFVPGGAWQFQLYFSASSGGGNPQFYIELYKYDGTTFTLIGDNSGAPESITGGTSIDLYTTLVACPQTPLNLTDRIAIRVYVFHSGRTITLHTQDIHICKVTTTFTYGVVSINGLTDTVQYLQVGTSGTDFNITQSGLDTHVFNLPDASATSRGALTSADWATFNNKQNAITQGNLTETTSNVLTIFGGTGAVIGGGTQILVKQATTAQDGYLSSTDWNTFNNKFNLPSLTSGSVLFSNGTTIAQDNSNLFWDNTNKVLGIGTNTPTSRLQIIGVDATSSNFALKVDNSLSSPLLYVRNDGNVGIGTNTPGQALEVTGNTLIRDNSAITPLNYDLEVHKTRNGEVSAWVRNNSSGNAAFAQIGTRVDSTTQFKMGIYSSGFTTSGLLTAGTAYLLSAGTNANKILIGNQTLPKDIIFVNGGTAATDEIFRISATNTIDIYDGRNLTFGTTTGTKFGTSTSQKLGFYNATPIIQPSAVTTPQGIATALSNLGLLATSTINSVTLTTTGTTGAATYTQATNTLNIPNYSGAGYITSVWNVTTQAGASYSASNSDYVLINAATQIVTLPAATANARVGVKMINATVTDIQVRTAGVGVTIDGIDRSSIGLGLYNQYDAYVFVSDGTNWWIES